MPYLFKLSRRISRFRARTLLGAAAVVVGACAKEVASPPAPAGGTTPVTLQLSAPDAAPGGSVAVFPAPRARRRAPARPAVTGSVMPPSTA